MSKEKVVIVGFGWVGQANAVALSLDGYEVSYFDLVAPELHYASEYKDHYDKIPKLDKLFDKESEQTWYIVCVGDRVSDSGEQDISNTEKALTELSQVSSRIVLRSTMLPSKLEGLSFKYYVPEFLHEKKAIPECTHPHLFVLGSREGGDLPSFLELWRSRASKVFLSSPKEASYIKYLSNIWNALRIAFVNEFGDAMASSGLKEGEVENAINFFFEGKSYLRYGKHYDGHCLPKDVRAFINEHDEEDIVDIIKAVPVSNQKHAQTQSDDTKEWYSSW